MKNTLKGKDLLSIYDLSNQEVEMILSLSQELKDKQKNDIPHRLLESKVLGMIFQKPSTRTRVSFQVGIFDLGGIGLFLSMSDLQTGRGETIGDTAMVLSRYLDAIMIRTYSQDDIKELAEYADIPVINGLTDLLHPCQALTDVFTVKEHLGKLKGIKMTYLGDGNNVAHSLMFAAARTGMNFSMACPTSYMPNAGILKLAQEEAEKTGSKIELYKNVDEAIQGADVLYTDVWVSMGQDEQREERLKTLAPYQINSQLLEKVPNAKVMHCLPAHRGEEITGNVLDSQNSIVIDQAENRLHVQKAILVLMMGNYPEEPEL